MNLIKKVFTREHLETNLYTTFILVSLVLMSFTSCTTTVELIDGLCYNDRDKSHLCLEEEDERDMEQLEPLYEACDKYIHTYDWYDCIMNKEKRQTLLNKARYTS